jgi:peptide/nickel transport system permease protein
MSTVARQRREEVSKPPTGLWTKALIRLLHHRLGTIGLASLAALALFSYVGPFFVPYEPDRASIIGRLQSPNPEHWFGTDELGRDTLVRVMHGGRVSLLVGLSVALASAVLGGLLGALSGYFGGLLDRSIMRVVDIVQSIPRIVLLLVLSKLVGPGLVSIIAILVLLEWSGAARIVRGQVLALREQTFVDAARVTGCNDRRIVLIHLLPNTLSTLIVAATLEAAAAIRAEATLSFLGLGIQPPTASWGNLLNNASGYFLTAPWQVYIPGAFIFLALISLNLVGDALRDALDPRIAGRAARGLGAASSAE